MAERQSDLRLDVRLSRRYRLIVGALVGASAVVVLTLVGALLEDPGAVISAGMGGTISGFLLAGAFGNSGLKGWIFSFVAYLGCSIVGGATGGAFMGLTDEIPGGPLAGLVMGAILAPVVFVMGGTLTLLPSLAILAIIHLVAIRLRRYEHVIEPDIAKRFE